MCSSLWRVPSYVITPFVYLYLVTGSEIYAGCSNGELIRFALQADDPNKVNSLVLGKLFSKYTIYSRSHTLSSLAKYHLATNR